MTGFNSNLDEVIAKFKAIKAKSQEIDFSEALLAGVNQSKARMENRIFNQGRDADYETLGKYRGKKKRVSQSRFEGRKIEFLFGNVGDNPLNLTPYELKRVKKGRQVRYKDLEFEGALRRGIVVVKESSKLVVCAIPDDKLYKIAKGQEEQLHTIIFQQSDNERAEMIQTVNTVIKQIYDRLFNS